MNKSILGTLLLIAYWVVSAAMYFASAGRADLPIAWFCFGFNIVLGLLLSILLALLSPGLIAERIKPGPGEQDRIFKIASSILTPLMLVLAGLDVGRYHWLGPVSPAIQITALVATVIAYGFISWAVVTNRFFSSAVRLQPDRQQVVVDKGPYAVIRHPGYTGTLVYMSLTGLALGSWLATAVAGIPLALLILRRTTLEDAMLRKGLPGYEEYARRVRYRLLPGIW